MKSIKITRIIASFLNIVKDLLEGESPNRYDHIADYLTEIMVPALRELAKEGESHERD